MAETTMQLSGVNKVFGAGSNQVTALADIDLTVNKGELALIIGPSGSGKSTMLTILGGLQTPTSGEVLIGNERLDQLSLKEAERLRLNKLGFVLQSYNLVPFLKVQEQFALVDRVKKTDNLNQEAFEQVIDVLGVRGLLSKYPTELSGGQQQRVAIARALYANPDIILADEPTAALDSNRVAEVGALFQTIAHEQDKSVVVVTHDLRLREFADVVYEIVDGRLSKVS
jgi:putative ABC transport system ATP-binding protein